MPQFWRTILLGASLAIAPALIAAGPADEVTRQATLWTNSDSRPATLQAIDTDAFAFDVEGAKVLKTAAEFQRFGNWLDIPRGPQVLLVDGSILVGDVLKIDGESLHLGDAAELGRCRFEGAVIPLAIVRGIVFQPPAAALSRDRLAQRMQSARPKEDILSLVGGENVPGLLLDSSTAVRFQVAGAARPLDVPPSRIEALTLNAALLQSAKNAPTFWLGLRDGNWLAVNSLSAAAGQAKFTLASGLELSTPLLTDDETNPQLWQAVCYLEPTLSDATFLSDLKPTAYHFQPQFSLEWQAEFDRSVVKGRLRSATGIARKGLGMHADSTIEFAVPAGSEIFVAEVAVDDGANERASAIGRVYLRDGDQSQWREVAATAVLRRGDPPEILRVPLADATSLRLETSSARDGNSSDYLNWQYARFVMPPK